MLGRFLQGAGAIGSVATAMVSDLVEEEVRAKAMAIMGGFIAANAALAMNDVNFLLIPEVPFEMYGENGFLKHLEKRLINRGHAVICTAEGAGQDLLIKDKDNLSHDASVS